MLLFYERSVTDSFYKPTKHSRLTMCIDVSGISYRQHVLRGHSGSDNGGKDGSCPAISNVRNNSRRCCVDICRESPRGADLGDCLSHLLTNCGGFLKCVCVAGVSRRDNFQRPCLAISENCGTCPCYGSRYGCCFCTQGHKCSVGSDCCDSTNSSSYGPRSELFSVQRHQTKSGHSRLNYISEVAGKSRIKVRYQH